jgi:hypothetical protein
MTDEYGEVCGMRIGKGRRLLGEIPPQSQCATEQRPTRWEVTY